MKNLIRRLATVLPITAARSLWWSFNRPARLRRLEGLRRDFPTLASYSEHIDRTRTDGLHHYVHCDEAAKRRIFAGLYDFLGADLRGSAMLDLGPGSADSLDEARIRGAVRTEFLEYNENFLHYCELKGHVGHLMDYRRPGALASLPPRSFDFILSKGSVNADFYNRAEPGVIKWPRFVDDLQCSAKPGAWIVICPTFDRGTATFGASYHLCSDPDALLRSPFARALEDRGYQRAVIPGFNEPLPRFPVTFWKRLPS